MFRLSMYNIKTQCAIQNLLKWGQNYVVGRMGGGWERGSGSGEMKKNQDIKK